MNQNPQGNRQQSPGNTLELVFFIMAGMGVFFLLSRPSANLASLVFRISLIVIGIGGWIAVQVWKLRNRS
jgi:hypothetical protein